MAGPFGRAKVDYMLRPWTATNTGHRSQQPFQVPPLLHPDTRGGDSNRRRIQQRGGRGSGTAGSGPGTKRGRWSTGLLPVLPAVRYCPCAADGRASPVPEPYDPDALHSLCPVEIAERPMNHLAARVTTRRGTHSRSATLDLGWSAPLARKRLCSKFDALTRPVFGQRASELLEALLGFSKAANTREALDPVLDSALFTVRQGAGP
jgi:hypothetical protein